MIPKYYTFGYRLPYFLSRELFGDRRRFGLDIRPEDPVWKEWLQISFENYQRNKDRAAVSFVDSSGYRVMERLDLTGKTVLEIGPGVLPHRPCWKGKPERYVIGDVRQEMLDHSSEILKEHDIPFESHLLTRSNKLPFEAESFDAIVSFYSLEHMNPLLETVTEIKRLLKTGGVLIGAIPCEGGLAWGTGRFLTTRRWMKKEYPRVDLNHIICWEHPNFADSILKLLDQHFQNDYLGYWPFGFPSIDFNLVAKFLYRKT